VDEYILPFNPIETDIAELIEQARGYDLVILGTLNAFTQSEQAELVRAVLKAGIPTVVVALRMPYDLAAFPEAPTFICSYGILEPSMRALAGAIFEEIDFTGRLPVSIPGLYPAGHGLNNANA
jgi:beta-N-acetylhexosaminidase